ncbi:MAG TPA: hypothetical protein VFK89_12675, partial [Actinomycetota bacterium]|nr:hypothetical protein [Actinomycetota bacterium]
TALGATAIVVAVVAFLTGSPSTTDAIDVAHGPGVVGLTVVGGHPTDVGAREGGVIVTDGEGGHIAHVDPATGELVSSLPLANDATEVAFGHDTAWIGDPSRGEIFQFDPRTDQLVQDPIELGGPAPSMSISVASPDKLWVVLGQQLLTVNTQTREVTHIGAARQPVDVAAELGTVWVLDGAEGLLRLDPDTGRQIGDAIPTPGKSGDGDVYAGAGTIWVGDRGDNTLVRVDPDTGAFLGTVRLDGYYLDLAFDSNAVWALSRTTGTTAELTALDLESAESIGEPLEIQGGAVEVATGAGSVWVALKDEGAVLKIDPQPFLDARR